MAGADRQQTMGAGRGLAGVIGRMLMVSKLIVSRLIVSKLTIAVSKDATNSSEKPIYPVIRTLLNN